jgi:hypothetical protein
MLDDIGIGNVRVEWTLNVIFLIIALLLAVYIWKRKNNLLLGIVVFSLLGNLIFYTDSGSLFYAIYNLKWIVKFTLWCWPWINTALFILLIINLIKKNARTKNT